MRIGIDLGGTKTELAALDADGGVCVRLRQPTPQGDYGATLNRIADMVKGVEANAGRRGTVGVGIPGSISPSTGLVRNANSTWLNGRRLRDDLSSALDRPVRVANDADCFALSEATDGVAAGADPVFGVILGTGVGGGLVAGGRLIAGANGIAGEWGHNPLPGTDGEARGCWCGRMNCIETFLSGPALEGDYARRTGVRRGAAAIAERTESDVDAADVLARYEERLARALASVINLLDPAVIVLGGGLSNVGRFYETVPRLWRDAAFADRIETRLLAPVHGDSSGVLGAARLWPATAESGAEA